MKILFVATQDDPLDINAGSSADYEYYRAFIRHGADVQIVGPFTDKPSLAEKAYRKIHGVFSKRRHAKHSLAFLHQIAKAVDEAIAVQKPDVIFSINTMGLAYCSARVPIVCRLDTSHRGHHTQYPLFSEVEVRRMIGWEKRTLRAASLVITYSDWNAGVLTNCYRVPRSTILVVPDPASLPEHVVPRTLISRPRVMQPLNLLLVGRNFHRKGVDIAIETVELLNNDGVAAELHVVGLEGEDSPHVHYKGLFRKDVESQLRAYVHEYRWAHFLLHPARFEPGGVALSEAAAFGLPAVTNAAGGLATTVRHGVSGIVLPAGSSARAYAEAMKPYLDDPESYLALSRTTRQRYEEELNWNVTGQKIFQALEKVVQSRRQDAAAISRR